MRYLVNYILLVLPISGCFSFKRWILSFVKIHVRKGGNINGHTWFYGRGNIVVGENTWIGPRCRFYSDITADISIGKNCDIAPEVAFVTGSHEISDKSRRAGRGFCESIIVEDGCWIGARVTIMGGVTIGAGSIIGAGSFVNRNISSNRIAVGVPAKVIRQLDDA